MSHRIDIEGFENQRVEVRPPGMVSGAKLLVDGQPAPKGKKRGEMVLRRDDGIEVVAKWKGQFLDVPKLVVDGKVFNVVEPLKWYQWVWVAAPILLVFVGGFLGALCGAIAFSVNVKVFRSDIEPILQYILTAVISIFAIVAYVVLVVLVLGALGV